MTIPTHTLITAVGNNINADLGEDMFISMNVELGRYYVVNPITSRILAHLETPKTLRDLVLLICREFEVSPDECKQDIAAFLPLLKDMGLVQLTPDLSQ